MSGLLGATVSGGLLTVVYIWVVYGLLTTVSDHCVWVAKLAHSDCVCVTKSWPTVSGLLSQSLCLHPTVSGLLGQSTVSAFHCVWVVKPAHCVWVTRSWPWVANHLVACS